jgi:NAD(P)-dependent dehydrogenase (short-subunit alcohol dehydrogenase family)
MDEMRFDGKVAVITGAGRGLGAAHARLLAARGAAVVVNDAGVNVRSGDERPDPAADVVAEITDAGGQAVADRHDVVADGGAIVEHAVDAFGAVDIVINNAGFAAGGPFAEMPVDVFDRACDVHIKGTRAVLRAAWPHLVRSGAGRVVNTASSAVFGAPGISPYATGKGAVFAFTRAVAHEGTPHGITVNVIMPIAITRLTAMLPEGRRQPLETHYPPERIAPVVAWLAHESTTITGECFAVGGGRAARVFLGETAGACLPDGAGPEDWAAHADEIFAMDGFGTPPTMYASAGFSAEVLGLGASGYESPTGGSDRPG